MNSENFRVVSIYRQCSPVAVPCVALLLLYLSLGTPWMAQADTFQESSPPFHPNQTALSVTPSLQVIKQAPDFMLLDTAGHPVRSSELRGRIVLVSFIYTNCPSACPLLTARMSALQKRLAREGAGGRRVRFLSITVDPARDSAPVLDQYAKRFNANLGAWKFLREEPQKLQAVLAAYEEWTRPQPNGEIDHPARLYLIDPQGRIREIYSLSFFDERQVFLDIQALLRESP